MSELQNPSFVLRNVRDVVFEDRPVPELKNDRDVLVQVKITGICGSDVHYWQEGRSGTFILTSPMVLGHESSGIVVRTGSSVTALKPGDRVSLEPGIPCRYCAHCKSGKYNLCPLMQFAATPPYDGTLAKYYVLPEDFCHLLPSHVTLEEGALVEPLSVAVHVVKQADLKPSDSAVVFGAGPVGLLCCAVARVFGASKIIAVDINPDRLTFARYHSATGTFNPLEKEEEGLQSSPEKDAKKIIEEHGLFPGADIVIEASGAERAMQTGIHVLRHGGTYVQVGGGKPAMQVPVAEICCRELTVKGSFRYGPGDYKLAVELIASRKVDVKELITARYRFEDAEKAYDNVKEGKGIKVLIEGPTEKKEKKARKGEGESENV